MHLRFWIDILYKNFFITLKWQDLILALLSRCPLVVICMSQFGQKVCSDLEPSFLGQKSRSYQTCVNPWPDPIFCFFWTYLLYISTLWCLLEKQCPLIQKGPWRWLPSNRCLVYFSLSDRKCPYKYHFLYNESVCMDMKINILFLKKWRQRKKRTIPCISTYSCCLSLGERIWILEDGTEQNLIHFLWRTSFILADKICPTLRCLTRSAVILPSWSSPDTN